MIITCKSTQNKCKKKKSLSLSLSFVLINFLHLFPLLPLYIIQNYIFCPRIVLGLLHIKLLTFLPYNYYSLFLTVLVNIFLDDFFNLDLYYQSCLGWTLSKLKIMVKLCSFFLDLLLKKRKHTWRRNSQSDIYNAKKI